MGEFFNNLSTTIYGEKKAVKNPNYPSESYEEFIVSLIGKKKKKYSYVCNFGRFSFIAFKPWSCKKKKAEKINGAVQFLYFQ